MSLLRTRSLGALLLCLVLLACEDDDPTRVTTYDIRIVNQTATTYTVWIDPDAGVAGFQDDGLAEANSTRVLENRTVEVDYHIRLVGPGGDVDTDFAFERTIRSSGEDVTWMVGP